MTRSPLIVLHVQAIFPPHFASTTYGFLFVACRREILRPGDESKVFHFMIETLCIVAEITAALLLFSLARPRSKSNDDRDLSTLLSETHTALEQGERAIQTLRFLSILTAVRSPDPQTLESGEESTQSLNQRLGELFGAISPLLPSMTTDSLTQLPERKAIESLIDITAEWQAWLEHPIQIAILQPDGMGDMDHHHGPVVCEKMLREAAEFLKGEIGGRGLIARFGFQAFAIALVGYSQDDAVKLLEKIRTKAASSTWILDELEIQSTFSASLVEVVNFEQSEIWEIPEDGLATAIAQGGNRGYWRDFSDDSWKPMGEYGDSERSHREIAEEESAIDSLDIPTESTAKEDTPSKAGSSSSAHASESPSSKSDKPSAADSVAETNETGATSDDIAALFQAAKRAKAESSTEIPQAQAAPATPEDDNISADDIASLFQAAKSRPADKPPKVAETPPIDKEDLNAKATSDDIADLFATVRGAVKPAIASPETTAKNTNNLSGAEYDKPALKSPEEMGAAATEDDIAALFKAFKK